MLSKGCVSFKYETEEDNVKRKNEVVYYLNRIGINMIGTRDYIHESSVYFEGDLLKVKFLEECLEKLEHKDSNWSICYSC